MLDNLTSSIQPFHQDERLIKALRKDGMPRFTCHPFPHPAIVAGRSSIIDKEIKLHNTLSDGIPIFRRKGGGCSVFLDPGNLIVSVAFPAEGISKINLHFKKALQWLVNGLKQSGIKPISMDGISDIVINDKKVGGTCFYRTKEIAYFSASILVASDLHLMEKYLYYPPRTPEYRKGRAHIDFVTNLKTHFKTISIKDLAHDLQKNMNLDIFKSTP